MSNKLSRIILLPGFEVWSTLPVVSHLYWNPDARGMDFGMNIKHEKQHFIRATIEGILHEIYSIGKMLREYRNISALSVNSSFATRPAGAQIIADMFDKLVYVTKNVSRVSFGAFLLAVTEMGIFKSLDEAATQIQVAREYILNENHHRVYAKYFEVFESLSHKLGDEFSKMAELQSS